MNAKPLCIRTFGETIRKQMSKKICIKNYISDAKNFESTLDVKNRTAVDGSLIGNFYSMLLLEAVLYMPKASEEHDLPDLRKEMMSQLKNGKTEIHDKIKEIAQRKNALNDVSHFFATNLIPNIPKTVLSVVIDEIDNLTQNDNRLGTELQSNLKKSRKNKTPADYLAEVLIVAICTGENRIDQKTHLVDSSNTTAASQEMAALLEAEKLLASIPQPPNITPPSKIELHEHAYISELYAAYGDTEENPDFNDETLQQYPVYQEDLKERRIDYFAAESINRGIMELYEGKQSEQFEVLKTETFDGVKNTARKQYLNGYERLLAVMEQAAIIQVNQFFLSRSPNWINTKIKMGVCHFLVTDGKLKWVIKNG